MLKVAAGAGHGIHTSGKRTPDDEREWSFNNIITTAFLDELNQYDGVETLRLDDPTGETDVSLDDRTDAANAFGADYLVSFHHNAFQGVWGSHTGTETYSYPGSTKGSAEFAQLIQDAILPAYGLHDRGTKTANFHMLRESFMTACLVEGGYMDSTIDIEKLRDDAVLRDAGKKAAIALANSESLIRTETGLIHVVKSGETLWGISQQYDVPVEEIKQKNNLSDNTIYPGQELIIKGEASKPKASAPESSTRVDGIKPVGKVEVSEVKNFTYIYAWTSDSSKRLAKAHKGSVYSISGSVPGWYEVIYKGERAYIKEKYCTKA